MNSKFGLSAKVFFYLFYKDLNRSKNIDIIIVL